MKKLSLIAALMLGTSTVAMAGEPINDPRAEIFRANGCDAEWLRAVENADGDVLYWTNTSGKGCKADRGKTPAAVVEEEEEEVVEEDPIDPVDEPVAVASN